MADDISRFVEILIDKYGLWRVITAPFVVVPILAAFGIVAGPEAASLLAIGTAFLVSFIIMIAMGAQLRRSRSLHLEQERTIMRLTETVIAEEVGATYVWEQWRQRVTISNNGDSIVEDWRTLRVNNDAELRVIWAALEKTGGHLSLRQRRSVKVDAFDFSEADGGRMVGVQYDLARVWDDREQALVVYVCFSRPLLAGQTKNVLFVWRWPGYYRELMAEGRDEVFFQCRRGTAREITLDMIFDKDCSLKREMRVQAYEQCPAPEQRLHPDGSLTLHVTYGPENIPKLAGFTLDNGNQPSISSL